MKSVVFFSTAAFAVNNWIRLIGDKKPDFLQLCRDFTTESMQRFMDTCSSADRGKILKTLSELTDRTGFNSALRTVDEAINLQIKDPDSLKNLYRRLYTDVPVLQPLESSMDMPLGRIIPLRNDLSVCDEALKGGAHHG